MSWCGSSCHAIGLLCRLFLGRSSVCSSFSSLPGVVCISVYLGCCSWSMYMLAGMQFNCNGWCRYTLAQSTIPIYDIHAPYPRRNRTVPGCSDLGAVTDINPASARCLTEAPRASAIIIPRHPFSLSLPLSLLPPHPPCLSPASSPSLTST